MTFVDPFKDPPVTALHMLDVLCEQREWRLQLCSDGEVPSQLTELRVVARVGQREQVASCVICDDAPVETAARAILVALRDQARQGSGS